MDNEIRKDWREYEKFVSELLKELDPTAEIEHNALINNRQIDVKITKKALDMDLLIIVQAKLYRKSVPVGDVDAFDSVIRELGAARGILVTNTGFTKGAKKKARLAKIDLRSVHDSSQKKFIATELLIPVVKTKVSIQLKLRHHFMKIGTSENTNLQVENLETALEEFATKWIKGTIATNAGKHSEKMDARVLIMKPDEVTDEFSSFEYEVFKKYYFRYITPEKYRGIKDEISGNFTPINMVFNYKNTWVEDNNWESLSNPSEIAIAVSHLTAEIVQADFKNLTISRLEWKKPTQKKQAPA